MTWSEFITLCPQVSRFNKLQSSKIMLIVNIILTIVILTLRFNNDPSIDILLLTTHVGGLGLNLTGADTVIFVEHDWNPMKDLQVRKSSRKLKNIAVWIWNYFKTVFSVTRNGTFLKRNSMVEDFGNAQWLFCCGRRKRRDVLKPLLNISGTGAAFQRRRWKRYSVCG